MARELYAEKSLRDQTKEIVAYCKGLMLIAGVLLLTTILWVAVLAGCMAIVMTCKALARVGGA